MPEMPAAGWFVARNREQDGPFTAARLRQLAKQGWVSPDDLVWHPTLSGWTPARRVDGLFGRGALARLLGATLPGVLFPGPGAPGPFSPGQVGPAPTAGGVPPAPAPKTPTPRRRRVRRHAPERPSVFDHIELRPRHLLAGCGILMTTLGLAFFTIAASPLARGLSGGGLVVVSLSLTPEIMRGIARVVAWLDRVRHEAAERRIEALQRASERSQLETEETRLADDERRAAASWSAPARPERVVIIQEPPRQRFNRWVAAGLSLVLPGLGHGYKGEMGPGFAWLVVVLVGYALAPALGLALHVFCTVGATLGEAWTEQRTTIVRE
jgi:hypothetical protein